MFFHGKKTSLFCVLFVFFLSALGSGYCASKEGVVPRQETQSMLSEVSSAPQAPLVSFGSINLKEIFAASPIIYSLLLIMSIGSVVVWLYTLFTFRVKDVLSREMVNDLRSYITCKEFNEAYAYCKSKKNLLSTLISSAIISRKHGPQFIVETIKSEGKRATTDYWQRISLLNDVVLIAPMLGLLGTVLGMFYAFYDINRSAESVIALFDGLGIAVGTTVAGLIVAIIAMIFSTTLKYRLIRTLRAVETEAIALGNLIEENPAKE